MQNRQYLQHFLIFLPPSLDYSTAIYFNALNLNRRNKSQIFQFHYSI
jgi:hypothetical protein